MEEMKISGLSWLKKITGALAKTSWKADQNLGKNRIAILGVGNELHGDDGAGVVIARKLISKCDQMSNLLIIEGGVAPENFSGPLRRFSPELLILVDAAQMGEAPGTIDWLEMGEIEGVTAATHGLPVSMMGSYLAEETGCQVGAIVIQPASMEFESGLSEEVSASVEEVVTGLLLLISNL